MRMQHALSLVPESRRSSDEVLLGVAEIQALVPRKSRWWITRNFAPEKRIKLGRDVYWYRSDALEFIDSRKGL